MFKRIKDKRKQKIKHKRKGELTWAAELISAHLTLFTPAAQHWEIGADTWAPPVSQCHAPHSAAAWHAEPTCLPLYRARVRTGLTLRSRAHRSVAQ